MATLPSTCLAQGGTLKLGFAGPEVRRGNSMGACYRWTCGKCGFEAETDGPWEFYRDAKGRIQDFGHPAPISEEGAEE